jgi:hypothetical protein
MHFHENGRFLTGKSFFHVPVRCHAKSGMKLISFSPHVENRHIHVKYKASFRDKVPEPQGTTAFAD